MKHFFYVFAISFMFINCNVQDEVKTITTKQLKALLEKRKIQLVDVRTPKEIKQGAIETAIFANYFDDDFLDKIIKKLNKEKPVYLYCRSGNRSGKAGKILQEKGYDVYNVLGGYNKWKSENSKK